MQTLLIIKGVQQTYEEIVENGCMMQMGDFLTLVSQAKAFVDVYRNNEAGEFLSFINYDKLAEWLNNPIYDEEEDD